MNKVHCSLEKLCNTFKKYKISHLCTPVHTVLYTSFYILYRKISKEENFRVLSENGYIL